MASSFPLERFVAGQMAPESFNHHSHVAAAFALLQTMDFADGVSTYATAVRQIAATAGKPSKFHMTVTVAMLAAIAERMPGEGANFDMFAGKHPELFERDFLLRHYSPERLNCPQARRTFLLPDRC